MGKNSFFQTETSHYICSDFKTSYLSLLVATPGLLVNQCGNRAELRFGSFTFAPMKSEFSGMYINPLIYPKGVSIVEVCSPKLDFLNGQDYTDEEVRLAIILFDSNSPVKRIRDDGQRAKAACDHIGIEYEKIGLTYPDWVKEAVAGKNEKFNRLCITYVAKTNSKEYAILEALVFSSLNIAARIMAGDSKAFDELRKIEDHIDERKNKLYNHLVDQKFSFDLDFYIVESKLDIDPLDIANLRLRGESVHPEFSQYDK